MRVEKKASLLYILAHFTAIPFSRMEPIRNDMGKDDVEWEPTKKKIELLLIAIAKSPEGVISYSELSDRLHDQLPHIHLNANSFALRHMLGELTEEYAKKITDENERFLMSSIVYNQEAWRPGDGFYDLAEQLGYLVPKEEDADGRLKFFFAQSRKVSDYWRNH